MHIGVRKQVNFMLLLTFVSHFINQMLNTQIFGHTLRASTTRKIAKKQVGKTSVICLKSDARVCVYANVNVIVQN